MHFLEAGAGGGSPLERKNWFWFFLGFQNQEKTKTIGFFPGASPPAPIQETNSGR
jgi:hypothetical protein